MYFGIWFVTHLYTYFALRKNIIKVIAFLFSFLFLMALVNPPSIINFLSNYFTATGQAVILYYIFLAFLAFGTFHFFIRKN